MTLKTVLVKAASFSLVQFSRSVVFVSLRPHESQHARPPCPSQTPRVYSNSGASSQWCHPAISSLLLLPPIPPSIRVFSNESTLRIRWPKYGSFSFSISPSSEHPGPISFRMDWLDLLAVQGTLRSLLQHHTSKASILWPSVQLCPTLYDSMDCGQAVSSVCGILQAIPGVGCHALLQGIFPIQGWNQGLLHCRWILNHLSYKGSPQTEKIKERGISGQKNQHFLCSVF